MKTKPISFIDRRTNPIYEYKPKIKRTAHFTFSKEKIKDESTGRIVSKTKIVKVDNAKVLSKYVYTDFSIENLEASGSLERMVPVKLNGDVFKNISSMEKQFDSISNSNNN